MIIFRSGYIEHPNKYQDPVSLSVKDHKTILFKKIDMQLPKDKPL